MLPCRGRCVVCCSVRACLRGPRRGRRHASSRSTTCRRTKLPRCPNPAPPPTVSKRSEPSVAVRAGRGARVLIATRRTCSCCSGGCSCDVGCASACGGGGGSSCAAPSPDAACWMRKRESRSGKPRDHARGARAGEAVSCVPLAGGRQMPCLACYVKTSQASAPKTITRRACHVVSGITIVWYDRTKVREAGLFRASAFGRRAPEAHLAPQHARRRVRERAQGVHEVRRDACHAPGQQHTRIRATQADDRLTTAGPMSKFRTLSRATSSFTHTL